MKKFLIICFSIPTLLFGQIDTLKIKSLIPKTYEYYAHNEFWRQINFRDQELRKSPDIETIDEENLISIIYYYNRFGYPDINRLGNNARIVQGIWGHNRYYKINQYTFPLILAGYKAGAIPEAAYREYYLRQMFQLKYDGNEYKTLPIEYLHSHLGLTEEKKLSVETVLSLFSEFKQIRGDTNLIIGRWLAISPADTFYFEGKTLFKKGERHEVVLYETAHEKYYLLQESVDNAMEPVELIPLNHELTKFAISGKESSKYYFITEEKDLLYTNDNRIIFKTYIACR